MSKLEDNISTCLTIEIGLTNSRETTKASKVSESKSINNERKKSKSDVMKINFRLRGAN